MSSNSLTFGVELEFALGCILDPVQDPSGPPCSKIIRFEPAEEDLKKETNFEENDLPAKTAVRFSSQRHITNSIQAAGLSAHADAFDGQNNYRHWVVSRDATVKGPPAPTIYDWLHVEVISPKLLLDSASLNEVNHVCKILHETYHTYNDHTSGLHVHVGNGDAGFTLEELIRIIQFLYTFEPQLNTLQTTERQDCSYCLPMRQESKFSHSWQAAHKAPPDIEDAIKMFGKCESIVELLDLAGVIPSANMGRYNFWGLQVIAKSFVSSSRVGNTLSHRTVKPTIEFRQHQGTLDGEAVVVWISTVTGIVQFCRNADEGTFENVVHHGRNMNVIDLLAAIGLVEQAEYYLKKTNNNVTLAELGQDKKDRSKGIVNRSEAWLVDAWARMKSRD